MTTDPKSIAERLTGAQRKAIRVMSGQFKQPPRGHAYWASTLTYGDRLTEFRHEAWPSRTRLYRLTPLGLAVREHLLAKEGGAS